MGIEVTDERLFNAERDQLRAEVARLREALKPFAVYAQASGFDRISRDTNMTQVSSLARRQVTVADFLRARAALEAKP